VQKALADLPWVDTDQFEIKDKQVLLTVKDPKQYDEKKITDALRAQFGDATVLKKLGK
jgi:hypothetical protein